MTHRPTLCLALGLLLLAGSGCGYREQRHQTNLVSYLYPQGAVPDPEPRKAVLQTPLAIGIAFVPPKSGRSDLRPGQKEDLLYRVRESFVDKDWVARIEVVPTTYLSPGGGFAEMQTVGRLFNVDVMVLISYDHLIHAQSNNLLSLTYLTIVGAHIVPGEQLDGTTFIDAAAYDVASRTYLLRAPGRSSVQALSTLNHVRTSMAKRTTQGFEQAMDDLAGNMDTAIERFTADLQQGRRDNVELIDRHGVSVRHGGAFGGIDLLILALVLIVAGSCAWRRSTSPSLQRV